MCCVVWVSVVETPIFLLLILLNFLLRFSTEKGLSKWVTAWKVSKYEDISGPYFPVFSPKTRKYGPETIPYLETFHEVSKCTVLSNPKQLQAHCTAWKVFVFGVTLVRIFPNLDWTRTRITPNKDTFYAVLNAVNLQ